MPLEPGQLIDDKYRIVRLIATGGMGSVYEGQNVRIQRRVAIKVLHAVLASDPIVAQRFEHEAQAAGRIGSRHIVEVLDLGELPDGDRYMVMEYLQGESLAARLKTRGMMTPEQLFPLALGLLKGLAAAHRQGIVHRDLKPANVFLVSDDEGLVDFVKVLDFGISKFRQMGGTNFTKPGAMLGTPHYMAAEQMRGDSTVDQRADLFAVGVILFRALTGRTPFMAETVEALLVSVTLDEPPRVEAIAPYVDPAVAAIVNRAIARRAEDRFQSAEEFAEELIRWLEGRQLALPTPVASWPRAQASAANSQRGPAVSAANPAIEAAGAPGRQPPTPASGPRQGNAPGLRPAVPHELGPHQLGTPEASPDSSPHQLGTHQLGTPEAPPDSGPSNPTPWLNTIGRTPAASPGARRRTVALGILVGAAALALGAVVAFAVVRVAPPAATGAVRETGSGQPTEKENLSPAALADSTASSAVAAASVSSEPTASQNLDANAPDAATTDAAPGAKAKAAPPTPRPTPRPGTHVSGPPPGRAKVENRSIRTDLD